MTEQETLAPGRPRILIPLDVLDDEQVPQGLVEVLGETEVLLLGYVEVPEQTPPGQARMQFQEECDEHLDGQAHRLEATGARVEKRLVFTGDARTTAERVAGELLADAVILPDPIKRVENVLLPLRGPVNLDRLMWVAYHLVTQPPRRLTLLHVCQEESDREPGELMLTGAQERLVELGLDAERIDRRVRVAEDAVAAIAEAGDDHQLIVMGETDPTLTSLLFGTFHEQVDEAFDGPMLVVRKQAEADEAAEDA